MDGLGACAGGGVAVVSGARRALALTLSLPTSSRAGVAPGASTAPSLHAHTHEVFVKKRGHAKPRTHPPITPPLFLSLPFASKKKSKSPHRVLARPLARRLLVPRAVGLVDVRDLGHQRVVRVGVGKQRANGEQHFRQRQSGRPLLLEDVEADGPLRVDVGVVDLKKGFWGGSRREFLY